MAERNERYRTIAYAQMGATPEQQAAHLRRMHELQRDAERVDHPEHYGGDTTYEVIKVIEAWGLGFHDGNAVKYIARAGKKDGADPVEDLKKARWYINRLIAQYEGP